MFTSRQFEQLTAEQQQVIREVCHHLSGLGPENDPAKFDDEAMQEAMDLLSPSEGCVPEGYTENLEQNIIRKLYAIYGLAAQRANEAGCVPIHKRPLCYVEPSVEDTSHVVVHDEDRVYLSFDKKVWWVGFDTLEQLANEVLAAQQEIQDRYRRQE